jgi:hypothetical protein
MTISLPLSLSTGDPMFHYVFLVRLHLSCPILFSWVIHPPTSIYLWLGVARHYLSVTFSVTSHYILLEIGYIYTSTSRLNGGTWTTHRGTRVCPWFIFFCLLGLLVCFLPLFFVCVWA